MTTIEIHPADKLLSLSPFSPFFPLPPLQSLHYFYFPSFPQKSFYWPPLFGDLKFLALYTRLPKEILLGEWHHKRCHGRSAYFRSGTSGEAFWNRVNFHKNSPGQQKLWKTIGKKKDKIENPQHSIIFSTPPVLPNNPNNTSIQKSRRREKKTQKSQSKERGASDPDRSTSGTTKNFLLLLLPLKFSPSRLGNHHWPLLLLRRRRDQGGNRWGEALMAQSQNYLLLQQPSLSLPLGYQNCFSNFRSLGLSLFQPKP